MFGRLKYWGAQIWNTKACTTSNFKDERFYLKKALEMDDNPLIWFNLGILFSRSDSLYMNTFLNEDLYSCKLDSTICCLEQALKLSGNDWIFNLNYALSLWLAGNNKEDAKEILKEAINNHFVGVELLGVLGIMEEKSNNTEYAVNLYSQMLIREPSVVDSPFYNELIQRNVGLSEAALEAAIHYFSDNTMDNPVSMAKLGVLLIKKGCYTEAQELLVNAVSEMPTMNRAWYYLGILAERDNQIQKSYDLFLKSIRLDRDDLLVLQKVSSFDPSYESELEMIKRRKVKEQAITLSDRYTVRSMKEPCIIVDLFDYFNPIN